MFFYSVYHLLLKACLCAEAWSTITTPAMRRIFDLALVNLCLNNFQHNIKALFSGTHSTLK